MEINLIGKNIVYITIMGFGNKTKSYSKYNIKEENIIELVEYGSEGSRKNVKALFSDIKQLKLNEELIEKPRLTNLYELLKFYLEHTTLNIIVFGFSHSCLIVHGAILKLKMIIDNENLNERLQNITIVTIGSPRYLPKELLRGKRIYNVYNIQDFLKDIRWFFKSYFKLPTFPKINDDRFKLKMHLNEKANIHYLQDENFIFVKFVGFKNSNYLYYHGSLNNIFIFFNFPFPQVINYFLYDSAINVINFDRELFAFGEKIEDINEITDLDLLKDKQIFPLYYLNIKKNFDVRNFNICKSKIYLLTHKQIEKIANINNNIYYHVSSTQYYLDIIKLANMDLNEIEIENEYINLLKYLCNFDRNIFLEELKEFKQSLNYNE